MSGQTREPEGLESLLQFCRTTRTELVREKADSLVSHCFDVGAELKVRKAVKALIELGGVDLAQKLLDEPMSFDDGDEAMRRLEEVEAWCESRLQAACPEGPSHSSCERFEVYDDQAGKTVVFDAADTESWGPVFGDEGWVAIEGIPEFSVAMTLYRHGSGHWTLISEKSHWEVGAWGDPEARRLGDADAADWLLRHGFDPPADVSHLASDSVFTPGPPLL